MAKERERDTKDILRDVKEDASGKADEYKESLRDRYNRSKEDIKEYSDKAKNNIRQRPIEAVAIAAGIGALLGMSMAASAVGMKHRYYDNRDNNHYYRRKIYNKARQEVRDFPHGLEEDVRRKPLESIGIAIGVGMLLGMLTGKRRWD